jgi:hypothetical protein
MIKKIKFLIALALLASATSVGAVAFSDIKFGTKQMGDAQWNVSACVYTTTCTSSGQNVGSMRAGNGVNFTLGSTQYMKFSYTNTDPAEPWTITVYNANGTVATVLGTYRIINAGQGYFMTSNASHPDAGNGTLWSTQSGMISGSKTFTEVLQPTQAQMDALADSYYSPDPIYTAGSTYTPPNNLCCGGSSSAFSASSTHTAKVSTFVNAPGHGNQVYIEQIGNSNTVTVSQSGSSNNYTNYYGNGSGNTVSITQSGNANTLVNYVDLSVVGNTNNVNLQQTSTGGAKGIFAAVGDNSHTLLVQQKDSGNHYASISLSGSSKNVDVTQQGSAAHMTSIGLSGNSVDLSLTQSGSTQQFYSINFNCATVGGCPKITVQQGQ